MFLVELSEQPWSGCSLQCSQSWAQHAPVLFTECVEGAVASAELQSSSGSLVPGGLWCDDGGGRGWGALPSIQSWTGRASGRGVAVTHRGSASGSPPAKTHIPGRRHLS